ncbi:MAG: hypothetical protein ACR2PL_24845 [Dehalococcoidia bacterium]
MLAGLAQEVVMLFDVAALIYGDGAGIGVVTSTKALSEQPTAGVHVAISQA